MTYQKREEIFAKEVLTIRDFMKLFSCSYAEAGEKIREIKRIVGDRIRINGKLHVLDYLDYVNAEKYRERYNQVPEDKTSVQHTSVCFPREETTL